MSGVEDLQVRFGIDTNGDSSADTYVDPEPDAAAYGGKIVSAPIWLRVRAEDPEVGFFDDRAVYAEESDTDERKFRRILVSRTISCPTAAADMRASDESFRHIRQHGAALVVGLLLLWY